MLCASTTDPRPKVPPGNLARDHLLCSMTGTLLTTVNIVGVTALHTSPRMQPVASIRVGPFDQCQPHSGSVCCHGLHISRASWVFGDPHTVPFVSPLAQTVPWSVLTAWPVHQLGRTQESPMSLCAQPSGPQSMSPVRLGPSPCRVPKNPRQKAGTTIARAVLGAG